MKPSNPFMIEVGNEFAKVYPANLIRPYRLVDWEGDKFATREEAQTAILICKIPSAQVIEILDEVRTTIKASERG